MPVSACSISDRGVAAPCDAIDNARRGSGEAGAGGDRSRGLSDHTTMSARFNLCKKGLAVGLRAPAGRDAAPTKRADIVIEGFRPGVAVSDFAMRR